MQFPKINEALKLGAWITAVVVLLNWLLSMAKIQVTQLFAISPTTGVTPTTGLALINVFEGLTKLNVMSILAVYISAIAIVYVGTFIMRLVPTNLRGRNEWQKNALVLLYGTIPLAILFVGYGGLNITSLVGLAIYYVAVAISLGFVQKYVKI